MADFFKKKIISISIFALSFIGLFAIFFCISTVIKPNKAPIQKEAEHHKSSTGISGRVNFGFEDITFTEYIHTPNGVKEKQISIQGKRLGMESKKLGFFRIALAKVICIKDVEVTFYEDNMPVSSLWAKRAVSNISFDSGSMGETLTRQIDFLGDIILITKDKRTLTCDKLRWDKKESCLFASGNCVLGYEGKRVKADLIKTGAKLKTFSAGKDKKKRLRKITRLFEERI